MRSLIRNSPTILTFKALEHVNKLVHKYYNYNYNFSCFLLPLAQYHYITVMCENKISCIWPVFVRASKCLAGLVIFLSYWSCWLPCFFSQSVTLRECIMNEEWTMKSTDDMPVKSWGSIWVKLKICAECNLFCFIVSDYIAALFHIYRIYSWHSFSLSLYPLQYCVLPFFFYNKGRASMLPLSRVLQLKNTSSLVKILLI